MITDGKFFFSSHFSAPIQPDPRLPLRLFATDRFPINKLNIYSSPEILPFLRHVLRDTPEFQTIRQSCFGKLFDIPSRQAQQSTKLIHSFLTRQLICGDEHTLWSVFGGNPLRYGLKEFGTVTGLNCGSFPEGYHPDTAKSVVAGKDQVWKKLFGKKKMITIAELCQMLEKDKDMSSWKKIRIALIIIVDGVLIAHKQVPRPTPRYVSMLRSLPTFFAFPWGRESFVKTISCMKPPKPAPPKIKDPVAWLVHKLKQRSFRLQGFPLTLQLVAFRAIPQLLDFIPDPLDHRTLMDLEDGYLPQHKSINSLDIRRVEFSSNVTIESQEDPGWGEWSNAAKDDCISYMKQLISDRYTFTKAMWPGGPLIKKETSSRKQRRISSYFTRSNVNNYTNEQLTAIVLGLQKQMKQMQKLLNKKKRKAHGRQTSFHTVLSRSKKPRTSHQEEQGAPFEQGVDAMDRDDHEEPQSPIISQYAAHLHRQPTDNMNTPSDANSNEPIHTPTVHVSADTDLITDELNPTDQVKFNESWFHIELQLLDVDAVDHETEDVHNSPDHDIQDSHPEPQSPRTIQNANGPIPDDHQTTPAREETKMKTTETRTFGTLYPGRLDPPSQIYDKAEHPDSPEISHILHHGVRIYDSKSPDPPLSRGPIFDKTAGPSSPPPIRLRLSPLPFTPLTSPVKSNESGLGFANHAASPNAFTATASSNSPPCIGRSTSAEENLQAEDPIIDLTKTKDPPRHVPSALENVLAKEFFSSPLIPALDLITPLPEREWELFHPILKTNLNVYHITPSEFEFSNKSLLEVAQPKQWTTTYQMEMLVHMLSARHSEVLQAEKAAFAPPILSSAINDIFDDFNKSGKKNKNNYVWDQRLVDIVLCTGKKWMEDIHTIYTPMLWNKSHWVGLAINLDMGLVEVLDPLPALHGVRRMAKWMKPMLTCLPYLVKKVAMCELTQFTGLKPFICTRIPDIYINGRSGDCGPVTMKFLELHAHGDPSPGMAGITDQIVDNIRKQYAMDIYKTMVLPASSSSSSRSNTGRHTKGIPTRCWCGSNLTTFGAQTKDNLFRRFYRCEIGVKRKTEPHLFKWVDEAIVDEINIVDDKHSQLKEDVDSFKMYTARRFENQAKQIDRTLHQIKMLMDARSISRDTQDNSALTTEDTLASPRMSSPRYNPLTNIAVGLIALGTMAWIYAKINN
ncbi:hypothetical protein Bca52824_022366 [Brassica carinata]|uniref:Ubiquitin-like protease family profile domain-containing protein n=1 Tax=Brassica carinata TaxID=52824 RepID=A0A8X8AR89_BRACI|nr:hypothetical protein Bca52824_022366 [Brassica carinata]